MITAGDAKRILEAFPFAPLAAITHGGPTLILAPHADDESLGCGGLIAAIVEAGQSVHVLVLTDGSKSHPNSISYPHSRLVAARQQEVRDAVAVLGLADCHVSFLGLPDAAAPAQGPSFQKAVQAITDHAQAMGATTILAPWEHDPHCDHEAAHLMAAAASALLPAHHWAYPVWGWTLPDSHTLLNPTLSGVRLDVNAHLPQKRRAIASHATQYTDLITDDPNGFRLPPGLLAVFDRPFETYIRLK